MTFGRPQRAFEAKRVCCAVSQCMTVVEPGKMMCLTHWLQEAVLRREIGHTYRARQMGDYQDAYRRAVDHVESATGVFTGVFEKPAKRDAAGLAGGEFCKVGPARPTNKKRADCDPARQEGGGLDPLTPPSKPIGMRVRRPRLTIRRLAAIEEALVKLQQQHLDYGDALLWVRGERAKRRARKAVRA